MLVRRFFNRSILDGLGFTMNLKSPGSRICFSKKLISEPSVDDDIESIKVGAKKCIFFFLVVCSWSLTAGHTFALLLVMHRLGNEMIKVIGNRYFSKKKKKTGNLFCPRFSAQSGQIIL